VNLGARGESKGRAPCSSGGILRTSPLNSLPQNFDKTLNESSKELLSHKKSKSFVLGGRSKVLTPKRTPLEQEYKKETNSSDSEDASELISNRVYNIKRLPNESLQDFMKRHKNSKKINK